MLKACLNFIKIIVSVRIVLSLRAPIVSTHYNYHKDQQISFEASLQICVLGKKTDKWVVNKNLVVSFTGNKIQKLDDYKKNPKERS
jgi:ABC-type uncharacterized transport system auxiliary subunit